MGRNQLDSDIFESVESEDIEIPDKEDTIDIYSYSTKDLINKYKSIRRKIDACEDEIEKESLIDLLEMLEVELERHGADIPD